MNKDDLRGLGDQVPTDVPLDSEGLQAMLASGPPEPPTSSVRPDLPPPPQSSEPTPVAEHGVTHDALPETGEENLRDSCNLPDEKTQAALKARYGELRVVPIPFSEGDDGKFRAYILRPLTRMQWRKFEEGAMQIVEKKGGATYEDILADKVVAAAVVWPGIPEHEQPLSRAGLIPTLFGCAQSISWFFNPEALMRATFPL